MQSSQGNVDFLHKAGDTFTTSNKGSQQQQQGKQQGKQQTQQQNKQQGKQQQQQSSRAGIQDEEDEGLEHLKNAITSLYTSSTPMNEIEEAFECYADDATFEDPMMSVRGKENIKLQFGSLRIFFPTFSPKDVHVFFDDNRLVLEWTVEYTMRLFSRVIPIHQITICEVSKEGEQYLIHSHKDVWSLTDLLGGIPAMDRIHRWQKETTGYVTSMLYRLPFGGRWSKQQQGDNKGPEEGDDDDESADTNKNTDKNKNADKDKKRDNSPSTREGKKNTGGSGSESERDKRSQ